MFKLIFFCIIFFLSNPARGQLTWHDSIQLKWSDFEGLPSCSSNLGALSTTSIECDYFFSDSCLQYSVKAVFFRQESWVIDSSKYLLEHELMHFAITEIYARKIRKYLSTAKNWRDEIIRNTISSLISKMDKYHKLYDNQTNHSLKTWEQKRWNMIIKRQINSLKLYDKIEELVCK